MYNFSIERMNEHLQLEIIKAICKAQLADCFFLRGHAVREFIPLSRKQFVTQEKKLV